MLTAEDSVATDDMLLTANEVAKRLRLTRQTIANMAATGKLPGINVTGAPTRPQWRFRRGDIERIAREGLR